MGVEGTVVGGGDSLKKKITLRNGVTLIVGNIIGSGIFLTPTAVLFASGSPALSLLSWSFAGLFSLIGAICYAELGTTIVKSGASYAYILEAFGEFIAFLRLWISVLVIEPTVQATIAITFGQYLLQPFNAYCEPDMLSTRLVAAACIFSIMYVNCINVRYGTRLTDVFAYAKVIALVVLIFTGLYYLFFTSSGQVANFTTGAWTNSKYDPLSIVIGLYQGLFSYSGWDTLNFLVEELQDPFVNMPKAIWISMPIVILIYVSINVAYLAVLTPSEIMSSAALANDMATRTLGPIGGICVPIAVAMSCWGGLNSSMMASSRLFMVGSREGHLPQWISMITFKGNSGTPAPAMIFTGLLTILYLLVPNVFDLVNYYSFTYWLTVGLSVAGQIYLRFTEPDRPRPIKFSLAWPIIFTLMCTMLIVVPLITQPVDTLIGCGMMFSGIIPWFLWKKTDWLESCGCIKAFANGCERTLGSITRTFQLLLPVIPGKLADE